VDYRGDKHADELSDATAATDFCGGRPGACLPRHQRRTPRESLSTISATTLGYGVDVGSQHIADASRRWAITLDDVGLVFVDTSELRSDDGQHPAGT
jgi:hypothetical protein